MRHIQTYEDFISESTGNYWPGYSDDGTADTIGDLRDLLYDPVNRWIKNQERAIMSTKGLEGEPKGQQEFYQKWMYANIITTLLQDGFYISPENLQKALKLYKETVNNPNFFDYRNTNKGEDDMMMRHIKSIIPELEKEVGDPHDRVYGNPNSGKRHYRPGFMEKFHREQLGINEETADEIYDKSWEDDYFKKATKNWPEYNRNPSHTHFAIIEILQGMMKKYPDVDWKSLLKDVASKIHGGLT